MNQPSEPLDSPAIDFQKTLETTLGVPFSRGNRITILRNGVEIFPPMLEAIRRAKSSIELLTFIYWTGDIAIEFARCLAERARAGVQVRVILDAIGASRMSEETIESMTSAGVDIVWFRPPVRWKIWEVDNRTHRKVLVCDGQIAFTGGVGIAKQWDGDARTPEEWRDTHLQIEGPAIHGIRAAFIDNWVEAGRSVRDELDQTLSSDPDTSVGTSNIQALKSSAAVNWSPIATMFHVLLTMARYKVRISTAYFVPDSAMIRLLTETAQRGVDVQILIPGPYHDERVAQLAQEDEYAPMLNSGIRIWTYQPTMMHAKVTTIDDNLAFVGSANFNQRSMSKDDELALLILDESVVQELDRHFEEDCTQSVELSVDQLRHRGPIRKLTTKVLGLFRQQM